MSLEHSSSPPRPDPKPRAAVVHTTPLSSSPYPQNNPPTEQGAVEVQDSQQADPPIPAPPQLAVQISYHSSFDRDQYELFIASDSAQGLPTSQPQRHDSGLGSSSPLQSVLSEPLVFSREAIVPDSQSLPGSSLYIPTSSRSLDIPGGSLQRTLSPFSYSNVVEDTTGSIGLGSQPPPEVSDPIQDPSSLGDLPIACRDHRPGTTRSHPAAEETKISKSQQGESEFCSKGASPSTTRSAVQEEPRDGTNSNQLAPFAASRSGSPIAPGLIVQTTERLSAAAQNTQEQDNCCHHQSEIPTSSLVFQTQIAVSSEDQSSQEGSVTDSALAGAFHKP